MNAFTSQRVVIAIAPSWPKYPGRFCQLAPAGWCFCLKWVYHRRSLRWTTPQSDGKTFVIMSSAWAFWISKCLFVAENHVGGGGEGRMALWTPLVIIITLDVESENRTVFPFSRVGHWCISLLGQALHAQAFQSLFRFGPCCSLDVIEGEHEGSVSVWPVCVTCRTNGRSWEHFWVRHFGPITLAEFGNEAGELNRPLRAGLRNLLPGSDWAPWWYPLVTHSFARTIRALGYVCPRWDSGHLPGLFFFVEIAPEEMGTDISQVGSNGTCIRKGGRKTRAIIWVWRPFCFHARGLNIAVAIAIYALAIVVPSLVFTILD